MPRLRNIFILCAFLLWIFPLGVFIKSIDEKRVCNGKRAICLCSHAVKTDKAANKVVLSHPFLQDNETSSSGGGSYFLTSQSKDIYSLGSFKLQNHNANLYSLLVCKSIEHVPKV